MDGLFILIIIGALFFGYMIASFYIGTAGVNLLLVIIALFIILFIISKKSDKKFKIEQAIKDANEKFGTNFEYSSIFPNILFDEKSLKVLIIDKNYSTCRDFNFILQWESDDSSYLKLIIDDTSHPYIVIHGNAKYITLISAKLALFNARWQEKVSHNIER